MTSIEVQVSERQFVRVAACVTSALVALSVVGEVAADRGEVIWNATSLDSEGSLATLWAIVQLTLCAGGALVVGVTRKRRGRPWAREWVGVAALLGLVALDEQLAFHEAVSFRLAEELDTHGLLFHAWVIPGLAVVALLAAVFARFVYTLPVGVRGLVVAGAATFVSGALGCEILGGWSADRSGQDAALTSTVYSAEEALELAGVAMMGLAVVRTLADEVPTVSVSVTPTGRS